MTDFSASTIGVTGASGHLGRAVLDNLLKRGAKRVVAITRDPAKLTGLPAAVEVRAGDFRDPASLAAAFAGVERLLIISTDGFDGPGGRAGAHIAAVDAAEKAGVKYVAYTSITSPYPDPVSLIADSHFWTEARITASAIPSWSFLRDNLYADFLIPGAQYAIQSGQLVHAGGKGGRAYITRDDCAAAAAGALLTAEGRRVFDVSGTASITGDDLAKILADLSGKPVAAVNVPADAFTAGLVQAGVPAEMAPVFARFDTDAGKGYLGIVTDAVEELTGKPAESVAAFLARNKAALLG